MTANRTRGTSRAGRGGAPESAGAAGGNRSAGGSTAGDSTAGDSADGAAGGTAGAGGSQAPIPTSYEKARDELADVVATLEDGGLTLDESLALWERGQALAAACETFLAGARERVQAALARADDQDEDENSDQP